MYHLQVTCIKDFKKKENKIQTYPQLDSKANVQILFALYQ